MSVKHDALDPTVVTEQSADTEEFHYPLTDLVANGRVFVLNNRGEMEQVRLLTYWKEDDLLTVCADGYEYDEDGVETRRWHGQRGPRSWEGGE